MVRTAKAIWSGTGKEGKGSISTQSAVLENTPYEFHSRFENGKHTNPEELLASAHAACFTMALAFGLNKAGFTADQLETECAVTVAPDNGGFTITKSELTLGAEIPGITQEQFDEIAAGAKAGCPVSKLFNCEITLDASLSGQSKAA
ncbi:MAG: OsmC family peroxiredoxin [Micavibrio aeruginosavorus]|uniref:OsmC family peroxiredoxin n=1 Tax=Micavibrio aeruginosavorus TaxID=349221 RepID=A0A2W5MXK6_9BACT|nr:MAG: OsmC family peroxiredoxin [Micavibrio aeruginosavorus]